MHHRSFGLTLLAVATALGLPGCVATGGSSAPVADAKSATVVNYGSLMRPRCEDADLKVIDGNREAVCRAYLESLDDKPVNRLSNQTVVTMGAHRMTVGCNYTIIGPNDHGAVPQAKTSIVYEQSLSAPLRYYIRAEMVAGECKVWISDTPPGPPAPLWKAFRP